MHRLLYLLLLCAAGSLSAQQMPERSLVRRGNRLYDKGLYDRAIGRYERALKAAAGQFEATYDLGNALYKAERYDRAEQTLLQAAADTLRTDAERAEAFYNLGNARFKQQKYQEALESYRRSMRLNPSDAEAKYNYAYTKYLLDRQQQNSGGDDRQNPDQNQNQNQDQNQNQNGNQNPNQDPNRDPNRDPNGGDRPNGPQRGGDRPEDRSEGDARQQPTPSGISPQEQEQMLDAIQAQEDKTQEKLKERQGVVVRGKKNW